MAMVEHMTGVDETWTEKMKHLISQHLAALQTEFERYSPDTDTGMADIVWDPFRSPATVIPDDDNQTQTELVSLKEDWGVKLKFQTESLPVFLGNDDRTVPQTIRHRYS